MLNYLLFVFWEISHEVDCLVFDSFTDEIEDRFILDSYPQKGLLKLFKAETNEIFLWDNFIFGDIFEDKNHIFAVNYERT